MKELKKQVAFLKSATAFKERIMNMKQKVFSAYITFWSPRIKEYFRQKMGISFLKRTQLMFSEADKDHINRFHGKILYIEQPTEPENLVWSNLYLGSAQKHLRRILSFLFSATLIVVMALLMIYISKIKDSRTASVSKACPSNVNFERNDQAFIDMIVKDYESMSPDGLVECFCEQNFRQMYD